MQDHLVGASILIVEDDASLRQLLAEFLDDAGFDITEADSGDQAILLLARHGMIFDLIFTDISLPGRADGNNVAAKAKQCNPGVPVLYSSACPESLTNKIGAGDAFLAKPCRLNDVITAVQELLSYAEQHRVPADAPYIYKTASAARLKRVSDLARKGGMEPEKT